MDFQDVQPLITFALGLGAGVFADYKAHKWLLGREREAREAERETLRKQQRVDFQRQLLIDVQEAMHELAREMTEVHLHDLRATVQEGLPWGSSPYPPEQNAREGELRRMLMKLKVRVLDDDLRNLVGDASSVMYQVVFANNQAAAELAFSQVTPTVNATNERIGVLLREVYT